MNYIITEYCSNFYVILTDGIDASIVYEAENITDCDEFINKEWENDG